MPRIANARDSQAVLGQHRPVPNHPIYRQRDKGAKDRKAWDRLTGSPYSFDQN